MTVTGSLAREHVFEPFLGVYMRQFKIFSAACALRRALSRVSCIRCQVYVMCQAAQAKVLHSMGAPKTTL